MAVIVVEGMAGSGREEVASKLSAALNCPVITSEQLATWAETRGVDRNEFLERLERPFSFLRRLLTGLVRALANERDSYVVPLVTPLFPDSGFPYYVRPDAGKEEASAAGPGKSAQERGPLDAAGMRHLLEELFTKRNGSGNVVIVGCGAEAVFQSTVEAMKVFLVAPAKERATRVAEELRVGLSEAERRVAQMDEARRRFSKDVFGVGWDDPRNYDLVLNTSGLPSSGIAALLLKTFEETRGQAGLSRAAN